MARQVLLLQVGVVLVLVVASVALAVYDARRDVRAQATDRALAVAEAVADSPAVVEAVQTSDPTPALQPYAERVRADTEVDFVVVMGLDRTRFTHPDPAQIGQPFVGDLGGAPDGVSFTQQYTGTLGPSMRAVVPVFDGDEVVAMVSVGITISAIDRQLREDLVLILVSALAVLAVGVLGAWLVGRRLRRQTHGLGEAEITRMYEYYTAVLHAVREGLLLIDDDGRVQLVNDEARRLLDLPDDVVGQRLDDLRLAPALVAAARGQQASDDDLYLAGDRTLVVSSAPAAWDGRSVGAVVTLRDHTELQSVTGELEVVRNLTESLRAQTHEAANRLHTVVSLIEMGRPEEAVAFATEELQLAQLLADRVVGSVGDPVLSALLLGKLAEAGERGIDLTVDGDLAGVDVPSRDLVTVIGNLVDNAFDAVAGREDRRVRVSLAGGAERHRDRRRRQRRGALPRGCAARPRARLDHQGFRGGRPRRRTGTRRPGRPSVRRVGGRRPVRPRWGRVHGDARSRAEMSVRVLVVEDEQLAAEAHAAYVGRVDGFELAGVARSAGEAARFLGSHEVDLVLLDLHLPDGHGLALVQRLRAAGRLVDVIAVTSARDADVVRHAVAQGVMLYLLKPFTFAGFRAKLEQYAAYRAELDQAPAEYVQDEVDRLLGSLRGASSTLPKGMSQETLRDVTVAVREAGAGLSATEVAEAVGASRVTVRRYLEHLADTGTVERHPRYGRSGRPEVEYRWK